MMNEIAIQNKNGVLNRFRYMDCFRFLNLIKTWQTDKFRQNVNFAFSLLVELSLNFFSRSMECGQNINYSQG